MKAYLVRRVAYLVPLLMGLSVFAFALGKLAPGDAAAALLRQQLSEPPTQQQIEQFRQRLGLDDPVVVQFARWAADAVRGDLGTSFGTGQSVARSLWQALPVTVELTALAFVIAVGCAIPLGVIAARRRGTVIDHISRVAALATASLPAFWFGYILIVVFAVQLQMFPTQGSGSATSYMLPALTLAVYPLGVLMRLTRASMLEVLGDEFILAARARGLPRLNIMVHALRVALNPVITYSGLLIGALLGGAVIVETVFGMPGLGKLMVDAINGRDYPMVQGFVLYVGALVLLVNLVVDLLYVAVDPRVSLVQTQTGAPSAPA